MVWIHSNLLYMSNMTYKRRKALHPTKSKKIQNNASFHQPLTIHSCNQNFQKAICSTRRKSRWPPYIYVPKGMLHSYWNLYTDLSRCSWDIIHKLLRYPSHNYCPCTKLLCTPFTSHSVLSKFSLYLFSSSFCCCLSVVTANTKFQQRLVEKVQLMMPMSAKSHMYLNMWYWLSLSQNHAVKIDSYWYWNY